jgi:site-specific DNA-methyltransferase (adenine-specific)
MAWRRTDGMGMSNVILDGRWEDKMPDISGVDLVVMDPPYGITPQKWDKRPEWKSLMSCLRESSKDTAQLWCFVRMPWAVDMYNAAIMAGWVYVQELIWEKQNAGGCTVDTLRKVHENLWHFKRPKATTFNLKEVRVPKTTRGDKSVRRRSDSTTQFMGTDNSAYIDDGMRLPRSVVRIRNVHRTDESVGHPTQKPVELISMLVKYSSNPGDIVLDPFMGSGTTPFTASILDRKWIGIDADHEWCVKARARINGSDDSLSM